MKVRSLVLALAATCGALGTPAFAKDVAADVAGEIGTRSALLQSRITKEMRAAAGIGDAIEGWARFEAADNPEFSHPVVTEWVKIRPENDFVVKYMYGKRSDESLEGGTNYFWRVKYGQSPAHVTTGDTNTFTTMSGSLESRAVRIAVVQGIDPSSPKLATALDTVAATKPDYVVFAGNSVVYDDAAAATTEETMRAKWHALLAQPKLVDLLGQVGSYWMKNDRDFRFAGADTTGERAPSAELGANVFREQIPITDPRDPTSLTFRSVQATRDLALWLMEVRDYRSANNAADNKDKSLWGPSQADWMERNVLTTPSAFRLVIQPSAIVGPDASTDSHVTAFKHERQAFLDHVKANKLAEQGLISIVGGNAQYVSTSPEGLQEISVGSLTAPAGVAPASGNVQVDFAGLPTAGFALIEVSAGVATIPAIGTTPAKPGVPSVLKISLINAETGAVVHTVTRTAKVE